MVTHTSDPNASKTKIMTWRLAWTTLQMVVSPIPAPRQSGTRSECFCFLKFPRWCHVSDPETNFDDLCIILLLLPNIPSTIPVPAP